MAARKTWEYMLRALILQIGRWRDDALAAGKKYELRRLDPALATDQEQREQDDTFRSLRREGKLASTQAALLEATLFIAPKRCEEQLRASIETDPARPRLSWCYDSPIVWSIPDMRVRQALPQGVEGPTDGYPALLLVHGNADLVPGWRALAADAGRTLLRVPLSRRLSAGVECFGAVENIADPALRWMWGLSAAGWQHPEENFYGAHRQLYIQGCGHMTFSSPLITEMGVRRSLGAKRASEQPILPRPPGVLPPPTTPPMKPDAPWHIKLWTPLDVALRSMWLMGRLIDGHLPKDLVTQAAASDAVSVSDRHLRRWIESGAIRTYGDDGAVSLAEVREAVPRLRKRRSRIKPKKQRPISNS